MMPKLRKTSPGIQPWWLSDATETCSTCSQAYAYHTEIRCLDCDGPLCPICVQVTTALEFSCPGCVEVACVEVASGGADGGKGKVSR